MKKSNKRRIIILIFLLLIIIMMVTALTKSRANKLIDITAIIIDNDKYVEDETATLQAINEGDVGYSITLPQAINGKIIDSYIFKNDEEESTKEEVQEEKEQQNETNIDVKNVEKQEIENNVEKQEIGNEENNITKDNVLKNNKKTDDSLKDNEKSEDTSTINKKSGEKIYLSKEESENKVVKLIVKFDYKEKAKKRLYNKLLSQDVGNNNVKIKAYVPYNAKIKVTEVEKNDVENKINSEVEDVAN